MSRRFRLLELYLKRLHAGYDINQKFLRKVAGHIVICRRMAKTSKEREIIRRARHWWDKQAKEFSMTWIGSRSVGNINKDLDDNDRQILRSLGIKPPDDI